MGAQRQTSRMVQAIASVQLFIKRCLMGLEDPGVPATAIDRDRWEWMQKFRVWQANRKVYLYPENWIRPELRDDKSQFYKELESELLQKDVSTQTIEDALTDRVEPAVLARWPELAPWLFPPSAICQCNLRCSPPAEGPWQWWWHQRP